MISSILKSAYGVTSLHAYEGFKYSTLSIAKKITQLIETKIDLNQVAIIGTTGLAAIAVLASIYTSSFLAFALSIALCATSCLTYKINLELKEKNGECKKQYNYILDEERHKKERLEEHQRMNASIDKLTDQLKRQKSVTEQLEQQLNRSLELVDYCDKTLEKAVSFSKYSQELTSDQKDVLAKQHSGLEDIKSIAEDLTEFKQILHIWLEQIKVTNPDEEREKFSQKILQILQDFKEGSRRELSNMLDQLANIQQQLILTQKNIVSSTKTLDRVSRDIESRIEKQKELDDNIEKRTAELMAIHHKLTKLHQELAESPKTGKKEV